MQDIYRHIISNLGCCKWNTIQTQHVTYCGSFPFQRLAKVKDPQVKRKTTLVESWLSKNHNSLSIGWWKTEPIQPVFCKFLFWNQSENTYTHGKKEKSHSTSFVQSPIPVGKNKPGALYHNQGLFYSIPPNMCRILSRMMIHKIHTCSIAAACIYISLLQVKIRTLELFNNPVFDLKPLCPSTKHCTNNCYDPLMKKLGNWWETHLQMVHVQLPCFSLVCLFFSAPYFVRAGFALRSCHPPRFVAVAHSPRDVAYLVASAVGCLVGHINCLFNL